MIRGAIFDADGTLLDSMYVWESIGERYLRSLGIEPRENLRETFRTYTLAQAARYYIDHYGVTLSVDEIMAGVNRMIEKLYFEEIRLRPGVAEFIRSLESRQIPMVIATATDRYLIEAALRRCGILPCFQGILTCKEYGSKEGPRIYEAARSVLGTSRDETWVFEDALHGAETAVRAGFPVLGIYDPSEPRQEELRTLSTIYLRSFTEADLNVFPL